MSELNKGVEARGMELRKLIDEKLKEDGKSIRNSNAIDALFSLDPGLKALRDVFTGSKEKIELRRQQLNVETILDLVIAFDDKLSGKDVSGVSKGLTILIEDAVVSGNLIGLDGKTSSQATRKAFEQPIDVKIKRVKAKNLTGVKLDVDKEMPMPEKLKVETDTAVVEFNPGPGREITLGKEENK